MVANGEGDRPDPKRDTTATGEGLFARIRTGEWPIVRIDLSEAYANVRSRARTLRRRRIISSVIAAVVLTSLGSVLGVYYVSSIPLPTAVPLPATTTVYYSDGTTVMARLGSQRRDLVRGDTLPKYVGQAVVAAEDPAYWLGSGTVISRQYARAATNLDGTTTASQARLLVMSWKLEDTYDKEQILEFYLNTVYFGRGSYGIEAAARAYFDVHAARLTLAQSVLLAGVNDSATTLAQLSESLLAARVLPYYLHLLDKVQGAAHFDVDERRALELHRELAARLPGYLVPRLVREIAGEPAKTAV